jgi:tRNA(Ile)-lysidine synthetase, N-terminal domain/tRNA(Ile)-lysidine synthetase, C-terminal domain
MNAADVEKYIEKYDMLKSGDTVVAGVSGGADSVCMLLILCELREKIGHKVAAVHLNHMIRGEEADRDEDFVRRLCDRLEIPLRCFHKNVPEIAEDEGLTCEEAGRKMRYLLFREVADELQDSSGRVRIAVAHNRDDLAETVIFNMARGSSLKGLTGIRPVRDDIIRPILFAGRSEIEEYLAERGESFCTDSTNLGDDYTRNKIRHIVIPVLNELNSGAVDHIFDMAMDASDIYDVIDEKATGFLNKCDIEKEKDGKSVLAIKLPTDELLKYDRIEKQEIVLAAMGIIAGRRKDITRRHIDAVLDIAKGRSGRRTSLPYGMSAEKSNDKLIIEKNRDVKFDELREAEAIGGRFITEITEEMDFSDFSNNLYTEIIDYDKIKGTLRIRFPKEDDTIVINNNGGRKKLSKLFTDMKIDRRLRPNWPVVADDSDVVWLPGLRLSEAYKIDSDSVRGIRMEYIREEEKKEY